MKIKYQFVDEEVVIEVSTELGKSLLDMDRTEFNNNQTERRRHISLDKMTYEGEAFTDPIHIPTHMEMSLDLANAISSLLQQQQELLIKVYFEGWSIVEIAREEGVNKSSIHKRLQRIYMQLEKFLK